MTKTEKIQAVAEFMLDNFLAEHHGSQFHTQCGDDDIFNGYVREIKTWDTAKLNEAFDALCCDDNWHDMDY